MLSKEGRHVEANKAYREVLNYFPKAPKAQLWLGQQLVADGMHALALEVMLKTRREDPASFENPRNDFRTTPPVMR
jgi:hypothetical protein